ncbi:MAG: ATP-binding cassette domain-containing protein [Hyphomicrobiales bacterium]|jgi:putative ABC transport system ATP-binding protein|nr:ATP-binding cassette domain-containing protein [Methylobacterium sp.]MCA4923467.1 ATP-binding cassette domain-containing protein [Methylobacterium sp.]MCE2933808.1 ATP-binding cassette domain-containing protein [Hyphomicrobiales bacterium]
MTNVIEIKGLGHWFGKGELRRQILFDVDLSIAPGEIVILTGPSGSGKTTLLTLIGALRAVEGGSLRLFGHELNGASDKDRVAVRRRIGFIFQQHNLLKFLSARQNVEMTLELDPMIDAAERKRRATAMLTKVGLGERLDHVPAKLSGGQKQRVAVARALVGNPDLVLADEPTASLDKVTGHEVASLIERLARERGAPILLVTHDPRILGIADRIVAMEDGRIVKSKEHPGGR